VNHLPGQKPGISGRPGSDTAAAEGQTTATTSSKAHTFYQASRKAELVPC
jgi:hypothetical protein